MIDGGCFRKSLINYELQINNYEFNYIVIARRERSERRGNLVVVA